MEGRKTLSGSKGYHKPVLLREVIEALDIKEDGWYLDATLGDGGHSLEILRLGGNVLGIDVDPEAIKRAKGRLGKLGPPAGSPRCEAGEAGGLGDIKLIQGNFRDLKSILQNQTETKDLKFKGCLFDLGVSSLQLETPERGFSFSKMGPLDMRMDPTLQVRALDLINAGRRKELNELFSKLGEEKYSWAVADAVVRARKVGYRVQGIGISNTKQLADLVEGIYRKKGIRKWKIHPATKVFQALRIAVNDELGALQEGLGQVINLIERNGRIVVISFHSLEDRIVKNIFKSWQTEGVGQVLTKKPIIPSEEEIRENPKSRSAKMRVFETSL